MLLRLVAGACLLLLVDDLNAQSLSLHECVTCSLYTPLIEHAVSHGEPRALELLRSEIEKQELSQEQKLHLVQYIANAEEQIVSSTSLRVPPYEFLAQTTDNSEEEKFLSKSVNSFVRGKQTSPVDREEADAGLAETIAAEADENFATDAVNAVVRQDEGGVPVAEESVVQFSQDDVEEAYRAAGYSLDGAAPAFTGLSDTGDAFLVDSDVASVDIEAAYRAAGYTLDTDATDLFSEPLIIDAEPTEGVSQFPLPAGAEQHFSKTYLRVRTRYLTYFFFDGMTATALGLKEGSNPSQFSSDSVKTAEFADQTLHMGQALLTFAAESSLLKKRGLDNSSSEAVIKALLSAFEELDAADAFPEIYGVSQPGFFLRDFIHNEKRRGVPTNWEISSDSKVMIEGGPRHQAAMSLDQTVSLFVGWWGVARYSTDATSRDTAKKQCDRVMNFLKDSLFFIKLPNGDSIPSNRGPEFRYAAGFLCKMAEATTGKDYYSSSSIDVTIKGDPIRFRDDNLGEFEIPGYKIPATMRVGLSHPLVVALKPAAVAVMTTPRIKVRFSDLFPGADTNVNLPCAHIEQAHPGGHTNMVACVHLTVQHSSGDLVATLPCAHMVKKHSNDTLPCAHMTAQHPGGHDGPTLPCAHLGKLHGSHTKKVGGIKVKVPCTHIGPQHPGGHTQTIPCVHLTQAHPGGHSAPCVHLTAAHPEGHKQYAPCVHPKAVHPAGDPINLPCAHFEQAHPSGHGFDLKALDIDVPLGEKVHPYTRHIVLQCFAFESQVNAVTEFVPIAMSSGHVWSALLRAQVMNDVPIGLLSAATKDALGAMPEARGPDNENTTPWTRSNRWERCTELEPSGDHPEVYNGLDYLGLEVLARLNGIN